MFKNARTRTALSSEASPSIMYAPAEPASTHAVTPERTASGSGSTPQ